jgi:hypothetical protein
MTRTIVPQVSDHAVVRYLQRVYELDFEALKREILTPEIAGQIAAGAITVTVRGFKAPVENGVIKTILPRDAVVSRRKAVRT